MPISVGMEIHEIFSVVFFNIINWGCGNPQTFEMEIAKFVAAFEQSLPVVIEHQRAITRNVVRLNTANCVIPTSILTINDVQIFVEC